MPLEVPGILLSDLDQTLAPHTTSVIIPKLHEEGILSDRHLKRLHQLNQQLRLGEIEHDYFAQVGLREWAKALEGRPYDQIERITEKAFDNIEFYSFVEPLCSDLLELNIPVILITNAPQFIAGGAMKRIGASGYRSSYFETENGVFTGLCHPLIDKRAETKDVQRQLLPKSKTTKTIALGNFPQDLPMLEEADHGFFLTSGTLPSEAYTSIPKHISQIEGNNIRPRILDLLSN